MQTQSDSANSAFSLLEQLEKAAKAYEDEKQNLKSITKDLQQKTRIAKEKRDSLQNQLVEAIAKDFTTGYSFTDSLFQHFPYEEHMFENLIAFHKEIENAPEGYVIIFTTGLYTNEDGSNYSFNLTIGKLDPQKKIRFTQEMLFPPHEWYIILPTSAYCSSRSNWRVLREEVGSVERMDESGKYREHSIKQLLPPFFGSSVKKPLIPQEEKFIIEEVSVAQTAMQAKLMIQIMVAAHFEKYEDKKITTNRDELIRRAVDAIDTL